MAYTRQNVELRPQLYHINCQAVVADLARTIEAIVSNGICRIREVFGLPK